MHERRRGSGQRSRREDYSASTKRALVEAALDLFSRQGYAGTSLDEIVAAARVTKGALYHHFKGKQDLFEAVLQGVEESAAGQIRAALKVVDDPWDKALTGLREFLTLVRSEEYRRIVIQEGPAVLGHHRYQEQEGQSTFGMIQEIVGGLLGSYALPQSTLDAFTRLFVGAMSATGMAVSNAADPDKASEDAEGAMMLVLAGIRSLVEASERESGEEA